MKTEPNWDEALSRVLAFLTALDLGGVEHRTRLALSIVEEARRRHPEDASRPPVELVMDLAMQALDQWFGLVVPGALGNRVASGVVAYHVAGAATRWPNSALRNDPPEDLKEALSAVSLRTGPDLAMSSMTSREMDYGALETIAHETWHKFAWTPLIRAVLIWTAIFFVALYFYDKYFPTK